MKSHDCEGLNDIQCWHADHFSEQLRLCRVRNIGEATCYIVACKAAQHRFPLEGDEVARMDEYIASRFGAPRAAREQQGVPAPVLVVS